MTFRELCLTARLVIAGLLSASGPAWAKDAPRTHEVVAKILAVDLQAKSIQAKMGMGPTQTVPVVGSAAEELDQLPVGRMFTLTFQDSDDGKRQQVIAIKRAKHASEL